MARGHTYIRSHRLSGAMLRYDIAAEEKTLLPKARDARSGRAAKTLVKQGALRATVTALRKGASLSEHRVDGAVSVHVLRGRVRFEADGRDEVVAGGGLVMFDVGVPHAATALADSVFLVTTAMA